MVQVAPLRQRLLGAHVAERAQQVAGDRQAGVVLEPGQAEIGDPEVALDVQQEVGRLDVAVHDAELVRVVERLGRLDAQRGGRSEVLAAAGGRGRSASRSRAWSRGVDCDRRPSVVVSAGSGDPRRTVAAFGGVTRPGRTADWRRLSIAAFGDRLGQGLPLDELHGVVVDAALAADGIDRDDVGVVELGGGQGLGLEPPELGRVHGRREREHLERHPAVQANAAPPRRPRPCPRGPPRRSSRKSPRSPIPGLAFTRFDRLRIGDQRRRGQRRLADELEAGQARLQVLGQLGMFGQQLVPRRRPALLGGGQVGVQDLDQPDLARRFVLLALSELCSRS